MLVTVPVALVHDYLTQRGGAERVVLSMVRAFPDAPLYTSLLDAGSTFAEFERGSVHTSPLNRVAAFRHHHRLAMPVLAPAFTMTSIDARVVLASSAGWAHGVRTLGRKVVYCHAPARWLYQERRYLGGRRGARWVALRLLGSPLRAWDVRAACSAHRYLANSSVTRRRIREVYGFEAEVMHPPVTIDVLGAQAPVPGLEPGFLLCVARLLPYKNVDLLLEAAREARGVRLVVAGGGPERARLLAAAPRNACLLGNVNDATLRWLYANCAGLVAASYEDFGLTPLEAAAFGRPTLAIHEGGYLDTIDDGITGLFCDELTPAALSRGFERLRERPWSALEIQAWAARFSEARFIARLRDVVAEEAARG